MCKEFINADDCADAFLFIKLHGEGGKYYSVGSGKEYSIKEVAETLKSISGFNGELIFDITKPESTNRRLLDSKTINELGWTPKVKFNDGLKQLYEKYFNRMASNPKSGGRLD